MLVVGSVYIEADIDLHWLHSPPKQTGLCGLPVKRTYSPRFECLPSTVVPRQAFACSEALSC